MPVSLVVEALFSAPGFLATKNSQVCFFQNLPLQTSYAFHEVVDFCVDQFPSLVPSSNKGHSKSFVRWRSVAWRASFLRIRVEPKHFATPCMCALFKLCQLESYASGTFVRRANRALISNATSCVNYLSGPRVGTQVARGKRFAQIHEKRQKVASSTTCCRSRHASCAELWNQRCLLLSLAQESLNVHSTLDCRVKTYASRALLTAALNAPDHDELQVWKLPDKLNPTIRPLMECIKVLIALGGYFFLFGALRLISIDFHTVERSHREA